MERRLVLMDHGVDGLRLDAINWLGKDTRWLNNPVRLGFRGYTRQEHRYDRDQPMGHEVLRELRKLLSHYSDIVLIGEASADTPGGPVAFYGNGTDELHMLFDFRLLKSPWQAGRFGRFLASDEQAIPEGGWATVVFSNHDQSRHINRYGKGGHAERRARAAAVLLLTLRGTPFLYYGEELGMRNAPLRYRDLRDPYTKRFWPFRIGRDPARTPMQWDESVHAGFTRGTPWLPVASNDPDLNAAQESKNPSSLLSLYSHLIRLRKAYPALSKGAYRHITTGPSDCLVFLRQQPSPSDTDPDIFVAVNFSADARTVTLSDFTKVGTVQLSTLSGPGSARPWNPAQFHLEPDEAIVVALPNGEAGR